LIPVTVKGVLFGFWSFLGAEINAGVLARSYLELEVPPASHTTAHEAAITVAPFRAWRGSQLIIARGPARDTIKREYTYQCHHSGALWVNSPS